MTQILSHDASILPHDHDRASAPTLGTLVNRISHCDKVPPWTYGATALMRDLARRALLA